MTTPIAPRDIMEIDEPSTAAEPMLRLDTARVLFADHALLRRDFPQLRSGALARRHPSLAAAPSHERPARERELIEAWLLRHAGLISGAQAAANEVNGPIAAAGGPIAYRPRHYGRAVIAPVDDDGGLLDLKGVGVAPGVRPRPGAHRDGLLPLDLLLLELLNQRLVEAVLRHAGEEVTGLPVYGAIDAGFDVLAPWPRAAGILVRRAHRRTRADQLPARGSVEHFVTTAVELVLRRYGVTSVNGTVARQLSRAADGTLVAHAVDRQVEDTGPALLAALWGRAGALDGPCYGANVQTTREVSARPLRAELVDFGHYAVRERFAAPLLGLVADRPLNWGGELLPGDPLYLQPDPALAVSTRVYGGAGLSEVDADPAIEHADADELGVPAGLRLSRARRTAIRLAHGWRRGDLDGAAIRAAIDDLVSCTCDWDGGARGALELSRRS